MDNQEFEHIARRLRPSLLSVGRRFFGTDSQAEDVAQETLMRLWQLRDRLEPGPIEALAVRMAKNWCVSQWRSRRQLLMVGEEAAGGRADDPTAEADELVDELWRAVGRLSATEQRLFRMRHELEMDIPQMAAATGIKPRSISAMLSTARKKVKQMLKEGGMI